MKVIAHYLPQFHEIPENDKWWGQGYTEWTALRNAKPLFPSHYQQRIPMGKNYYDLSDIKVIEWQAKLAKAYGIYGFCFWHYWFDNKLLLEKPTQNILKSGVPKIPFCFAWANEPWSGTWYGQKNKILMDQKYGGKADWRRHFEYLTSFFRDPRYIKVNGSPVFLILNSKHISLCNEMLDFFQELSLKAGFSGIFFIQILSRYPIDKRKLHFDAQVYFEPGFTITHEMPFLWRTLRKAKALSRRIINKSALPFNFIENIIDYDKVYRNIVNRESSGDLLVIPGAFTDWDNTPRRQYSSTVYAKSTPENFGKHFEALLKKYSSSYKSHFLFINAWNEWAEGAYLEPDEKYGFGYLEALKKALKNNKSLLNNGVLNRA